MWMPLSYCGVMMQVLSLFAVTSEQAARTGIGFDVQQATTTQIKLEVHVTNVGPEEIRVGPGDFEFLFLDVTGRQIGDVVQPKAGPDQVITVKPEADGVTILPITLAVKLPRAFNPPPQGRGATYRLEMRWRSRPQHVTYRYLEYRPDPTKNEKRSD